ncbi:MAG: hypothetical protein JNL96_10935 [Planctomycetaceae bacterium]|nr:hypothetical protein [Planctomycetaceae bacterium]
MFWINPRYQTLLAKATLESYDDAAELKPTDDHVEKQGRSTARYRLVAGDEVLSVYVKKQFRLSWWQRLLGPASSFPGPQEHAHLEKAAALGVRVPEAVFAGADAAHPCGSILATRELEGYLPLHIYIPGPLARMPAERRRQRKRALIARLVDIAQRLHNEKLYHRDFYCCHFFLRDDADRPDGFDLVLIDLGRLLHSRLPRWQVKDLAALLFSTYIPGVTRTDRLRFFKQYLGLKKLDAEAKRYAYRIQRKAERYRRHNRGRTAAA